MAVITILNQQGESGETLELIPEIFEVDLDLALVHEAVVAQETNSRHAIAHTKDRGEVRGGGKKPWKQKGTGRARHGSSRSPIWIGGGVTFGPTKFRSFSKKMNKQARQKALRMILTDKVKTGCFFVVNSFSFENKKTKEFAKLLTTLSLVNKPVLLLGAPEDRDLKRITRNIPRVTALSIMSLNIVDLLRNEYVVCSQPALEFFVKNFSL